MRSTRECLHAGVKMKGDSLLPKRTRASLHPMVSNERERRGRRLPSCCRFRDNKGISTCQHRNGGERCPTLLAREREGGSTSGIKTRRGEEAGGGYSPASVETEENEKAGMGSPRARVEMRGWPPAELICQLYEMKKKQRHTSACLSCPASPTL